MPIHQTAPRPFLKGVILKERLMRRKAHIICRRQASCAESTSFDISTTISSLAEGDFISSAAEASDFISGAASFAVGAAAGSSLPRRASPHKARSSFKRLKNVAIFWRFFVFFGFTSANPSAII